MLARTTIGILIAAICVLSGCSKQVSNYPKIPADPDIPSEADESPKYKPIDRETIAAYEKLGAFSGGFEIRAFASLQFFAGKRGAAKRLPGFDLVPLNDGSLPKLPPVQVSFGIRFHNTKLTDRGVKKLKDLKNLIALGLYGTQVTDVGLTELTELKNLTTLSLGGTQVTDAGLKELKELKSLTMLDLSKHKGQWRWPEGTRGTQEPHPP